MMETKSDEYILNRHADTYDKIISSHLETQATKFSLFFNGATFSLVIQTASTR
jgi:L-rhamnose mutarotase